MKRKQVLAGKVLSVILIIGIIFQTISGTLLASADEISGSGFSMKYYSGSSWTSFSDKTTASGITAIKLITTSSEYYLQYGVQMSGRTSFWSSVNSNVLTMETYAGAGHLDNVENGIELLRIKVINSTDNSSIKEGIVVMYRVKVEGEWLAWVSNADPEWMQSVKSKYNLEGTLDTSGSYAGISGKNIKAIEIRIFEENNITTTCGSKNAKTIYARYIYQMNGFPTGWYHNFEKHLEVSGENILIYDSPSVYSRYEKESDTVYNCVTKGKENYVLTKHEDNSYVLDCNKNGKVYFGSYGNLISRTGTISSIVIMGRNLLQQTKLTALVPRTKIRATYTIALIAFDRILMTKNKVGSADSK